MIFSGEADFHANLRIRENLREVAERESDAAEINVLCAVFKVYMVVRTIFLRCLHNNRNFVSINDYVDWLVPQPRADENDYNAIRGEGGGEEGHHHIGP